MGDDVAWPVSHEAALMKVSCSIYRSKAKDGMLPGRTAQKDLSELAGNS